MTQKITVVKKNRYIFSGIWLTHPNTNSSYFNVTLIRSHPITNSSLGNPYYKLTLFIKKFKVTDCCIVYFGSLAGPLLPSQTKYRFPHSPQWHIPIPKNYFWTLPSQTEFQFQKTIFELSPHRRNKVTSLTPVTYCISPAPLSPPPVPRNMLKFSPVPIWIIPNRTHE